MLHLLFGIGANGLAGRTIQVSNISGAATANASPGTRWPSVAMKLALRTTCDGWSDLQPQEIMVDFDASRSFPQALEAEHHEGRCSVACSADATVPAFVNHRSLSLSLSLSLLSSCL